MTTLSELFPVGGGGNTSDFVASGTLPNGSPVILKANGQVEVVTGTAAIVQSIPTGSEVVFSSANSYYVSISYDPNNANKFVAVWMDAGNSNHGKAVVGTVSGTSISYGTTVTWNAAATGYVSNCAFDPNTNNKFVIAFQDDSNSGQGTAILGTISGTSLSFGSKYVFNAAQTSYPVVGFDPSTAGKFVVAFGGTGQSVVGTVSGTAISYGTVVNFNGLTADISISFDPNTSGKFVIVYKDRSNANYGKAIVGTISGTSLSYGTEVTFEPNAVTQMKVAYDPSTANKVVIIYKNDFSGDKGTSVVGTVSGTSISYGTTVLFSATSTAQLSIAFQQTGSKFAVVFKDTPNSNKGTVMLGTLSGTSVSYASDKFVINSAQFEYTSISFDPNTAGKFVVAYRDTSNSNYATAILGQVGIPVVTNLTSTNFLGTATAAYTNGQTASIMLKGGISDNQTSLTAGSTYYVQPTGTFATTSNANTVLAGKAVSATSLLLNGLDEIPSQSGNTGKFLTTDGSAASWGTVAPSSDGVVLLATVTASGATTVEFDGDFSSTYDTYKVVCDDLYGSAESIELRLRFGAHDYYPDTGYQTHNQRQRTGSSSHGGTYAATHLNSSGYIEVVKSLGHNASYAINDRTYFEMFLYNPLPTTPHIMCRWDGVTGRGDVITMHGVGRQTTDVAFTRMKFYSSADNFTGTFKLYGVVK